jgi:hypothetical protein
MPEIRNPLPCADCKAPQAADVRFGVGQGMFVGGANLSPSGLPLMCCRIRTLGAGPPSGPSAPATAAASSAGRFAFGFGRRSTDGFGRRCADGIIRREWPCG